MNIQPITHDLLARSVIAVPPLARTGDLAIDHAENRRMVEYLEQGGVTTLLYGGNAVLYHIALSEYAEMLEMLAEISSEATTVIPSVGPAYGTMMDQAAILREFDYPTVMVLPQEAIATSSGITTGTRKFAEAFGKPIVLYIKHDRYMEPEQVRELVDDGLVSAIKYAVVRDDPADDNYLREIIDAVGPDRIVSGIGEQPAIIHMRDFGLAGFTSGCICIAPALSMQMLAAIAAQRYEEAEAIREKFCGLEDLRNDINPIRVLHDAVQIAGISRTGPIMPLLTSISPSEWKLVENAVAELLGAAGLS
ncbi:dihydrodipicolinate synthase family protein [Allorhodopirellula solitaria]|uniref:5-dehydro-4-deoxyglucarate dehydratase n=1 Tax=Allorhodopirellula solitaria TaxID=2527987 RepID=A0A5C5X2C3_9BACT|nr:dihydrodipicolinate synthase family protein [Allorhodopirellula solitaria]TWT56401.1 5-dehydro-4-deoxyglucarate dehydratase [Allorhodopirellula solitaria]